VKAVEATRETSADKGKVITVFSLRGGAGVSSIALNLAIALAQLWETEVSLIDLAMASSHLVMMLDLKSKYTIANLAEYQQSNELDGEAISGFLTDHESGVRLLAGLRRPELVDLIPPSLVPTALSYLKDRFAYVVIDTDSSFSEHNLEVLDASDVIVLVVNPEMASMQASTSALDVFASLDYSADKIVAILNCTFPKGGLPQKNIEAALRKAIQTAIPYEETLFVDAINRGLPPVWKQPNAPASLVIQELAYRLSSLGHTTNPPQNPSETWKRVQAYMQRKKR
jgi:pilus assembly protein CpaE